MEEGDDGVFVDNGDVLSELVLDNQDQVLEEEEGEAAHVFLGHKGSIVSVDCCPVDSTLVATGGCDDKAFLWRIGCGEPPCTLEHTDTVAVVAFSRDGRLLASGAVDGVVNIWDVSTCALRHRLDGPSEEIEWLNWHPFGYFILAGSRDYSTWMWNADTGAFLRVFLGHQDAVLCGCFTPDGKLVCTGSEESLRVWDPNSGECIRLFNQGVNCLALSSDSKLAVTGSNQGLVRLLNMESGKVLRQSDDVHEASVECIAVSPSLPILATGGQDNRLIVWDLHRLLPRYICEHTSAVYQLVWSAGALVCSGCEDGTVWLWNASSGSCLRRFEDQSDKIQGLALTSDGRFIVSGSEDATSMAFVIP